MTGLVERLRDIAPGDDDMPVTRRAMLEAATALEAKDKELAALRDLLDQWRNHAGPYWQARAETAERELEREREAFQRHEQTLRDNSINSHSEAVVLVTTLRQVFDDILDELGCERNNEAALEAIATLRRERDEARAALKPFAEAADDLDDSNQDRMEIWEAPCAMQITAGDLRRAARAITGKD